MARKQDSNLPTNPTEQLANLHVDIGNRLSAAARLATTNAEQTACHVLARLTSHSLQTLELLYSLAIELTETAVPQRGQRDYRFKSPPHQLTDLDDL